MYGGQFDGAIVPYAPAGGTGGGVREGWVRLGAGPRNGADGTVQQLCQSRVMTRTPKRSPSSGTRSSTPWKSRP